MTVANMTNRVNSQYYNLFLLRGNTAIITITNIVTTKIDVQQSDITA